jgi:ribose transport system ATP-binding protein
MPELNNECPRLQMSGISKSFGATRALRDVSLEVSPGEILALVGENGAGKSTLMKVLSGAHQPDSGEMRVDGESYKPKNPLEARNSGVAMIYQELSLAPHLTVMENILLGVEPTSGPFVKWGEIKRRASDALSQIGLGDVDPKTEVRNLSIARQQMVEIARAIALDCKVLVLDEPTSSLTRGDIEQLFALINRLKARDISVIYISHFLEEVKEISDRITILRDGQSVGSKDTENVEADEIVAMMVGREVSDLYPRSPRGSDGEVVLNVSDLSGVSKPQSASLTVRRGQVFGIAGLVGAGRTEMMRAIFGLDKVKSGQITVGTFSGHANPASRWRSGVGMVSEDRKQEGLALNLSIADNITLPKLGGLGIGRFVFPSRQQQTSKQWIKKVEVKCQGPGQPVSALSGGNQQKIAIARLLHADVDLLLLDEPTRGIDVGSKAQIYKLIDELASGDASTGRPPKAVLLISSYLPELLGVCDQIAVMDRGRLSDSRPVAQWDEQKLMMVATGQE